ncbi:MAG: tRNA pseudouridine(13) synthase TruD [Planctomycetota bacterium]|nr:tRNA pseudouridine(13) synthase TruD [Planctomycetota bacterium]
MSYLTAGLPGTGGAIKVTPEDFCVHEAPLYEASGEGSHLYVHIEKRGMPTFEAVRRLAKALGVRERDVGCAGLKDARSVSRQWLSVEHIDRERVLDLDLPGLTVLEAKAHRNKLKLGHLASNRFEVVVRGAEDAAARVPPILDVLRRRGVPNWFGAQRFGARGITHLLGEALLRRDYDAFLQQLLGGDESLDTSPALAEARRLFNGGDRAAALETMPNKMRVEKKALHALVRYGDAKRATFAVPTTMRRLYVCAFQSRLFNRILEARLDGVDRLQEGDLALLHRNGGVFRVRSVADEQPRCDAFEISPSGPMFGTRSIVAEGEPGRLERATLDATGLGLRDFNVGSGIRLQGARRALRVPLAEVSFEPMDDAYRVAFRLPPGSFATVVLRELMKTADVDSATPRPPARTGDFSDTL